MRELPPPDAINKPHDGDHIVMLPPDGWLCLHCPALDVQGTIEWIEGPDRKNYGRCRECGAKYCLAER